MAVEQTRITTAEFLEWSNLPEQADRLFELVEGEIVEKVASFTPSRIAVNVSTEIRVYLKSNPIGYVTGADGTYVLSDENVFMPDVGYISKERLPETPEGVVYAAPDLAVEVKSPTDSKRKMRQKAELYLEHGVKIVWLVFPDEQLVEVYLADVEKDVIEVGFDSTLDGRDVLAGFSLLIKDVFSE